MATPSNTTATRKEEYSNSFATTTTQEKANHNKNNNKLRGLSLLSGSLGALASCFAKLAFSSSSPVPAAAAAAAAAAAHGNNATTAADTMVPHLVETVTQFCQDHIAVSWNHPILFSARNDNNNDDDPYSLCHVLAMASTRGLCVVAMIACNAVMLGSFLQGLKESGSVAGTALAVAANFTISAALGFIVWNERFPQTWWYGFGMVVVGTYMLSTVRAVPLPPARTTTTSTTNHHRMESRFTKKKQ